MLARIVYVSRAAPGVTLETVFGIIRAAHPANARDGLSGGLIFLDGCFAQALEGPAPALDAAFARIGRDSRHGPVGLRARERALCRLFPGPLALRSRACLDPGLLDGFGYRPGFPVERFPADVLLEFLVRACRGRRAAAAGRPAL